MELELRTLVSELEGKNTEEKYLALAKTFYREVLSNALDEVAKTFAPIDWLDLILEHAEPSDALSEYGEVHEGMTEIFITVPVKLVSPDGDANEDYELTIYDLWQKRYKSSLYVNVKSPVDQFDWSLLDRIEWGIWGMWLSWETLSVSENYNRPGLPWLERNYCSNCFGKIDIYNAG